MRSICENSDGVGQVATNTLGNDEENWYKAHDSEFFHGFVVGQKILVLRFLEIVAFIHTIW